ncbi:MAG: NUDIX domain-containing protein [Bacilli bacterium]|nr:NUDIX domain-containing protein [Bacilli bacterium]
MELLDIYDDNGKITGKTMVRGDKSRKIEPNEHIALATIFIENSEGEFLIQKTSKEKGNIFSTTGGHVDSGETPLDTIIRETKEEIGVDIHSDEIEEYGYMMFDMPLRFIFYVKKDVDVSHLKLQKEEVDYVKYMSVDEIQDLIESGQMLKSHGIQFNELLTKLNNKQLKK